MNFYEDENLQISISSNQIAHCYIKCKKLNKQVAQDLVNKRLELFNGKKYYCILEFSSKVTPHKTALKYLSSKKAKQGILAAAIVIDMSLMIIFLNMYIKITSTEFPFKTFNSNISAHRWIKAIQVSKRSNYKQAV